jgi:hypothetical protein
LEYCSDPTETFTCATKNDVTGESGGGVYRYDGTTGMFIDNFVPPVSGLISGATYFTFTKTDPVTLNYKP